MLWEDSTFASFVSICVILWVSFIILVTILIKFRISQEISVRFGGFVVITRVSLFNNVIGICSAFVRFETCSTPSRCTFSTCSNVACESKMFVIRCYKFVYRVLTLMRYECFFIVNYSTLDTGGPLETRNSGGVQGSAAGMTCIAETGNYIIQILFKFAVLFWLITVVSIVFWMDVNWKQEFGDDTYPVISKIYAVEWISQRWCENWWLPKPITNLYSTVNWNLNVEY